MAFIPTLPLSSDAYGLLSCRVTPAIFPRIDVSYTFSFVLC